nr:hypothetical protein [Deltaproteobacteria bacterium]
LVVTASFGLCVSACDTEPETGEPFAELALAVLDADPTPTSAPVPGPGPVADVTTPTPPPRCAIDLNGDGILTMWEYNNAIPKQPSACAAAGGASMGPLGKVNVPSLLVDIEPPADLVGRGTPTASGGGTISLPAAPIPDVVLDWVDGTGIPDREYSEDYDCDDFASDLEKAFDAVLPGAGTFTYIVCGYDEKTGKYDDSTAHAITDVHGGGAIGWIEPQTGEAADIDQNGDGQVTFGTDFSGWPTPTDGDCFIAVFESAEAAEAAGLTLD